MSEQKFLHALTAICCGGCDSRIIGEYRNSDEEFSRKEIVDFEQSLVDDHLWIRHQSTSGSNSFSCSALFYNKLLEKFVCGKGKFDFTKYNLTNEMVERFRNMKSVNPEYFGKATVTNDPS